jgi:hypothetical protein
MTSHLRFTLRRLLLCAGPALALLPAAGCDQMKAEAPTPIPKRYEDLGEKPNVPDFMVGTIWERVEMGNTNGYPVSGYGLVVNLDHSGNNDQLPTAVKAYMVAQMVKRGFGSPLLPGYRNLSPEAVLADDRVSVVQVDALLPPGVRRGQQFDVRVSVLPRAQTTSLAHGELYLTDLAINGADPHNPIGKINVMGEAEGFVFVNPAYALDVASVPVGPARAALRTGIIMNGAIALADRPIFLRLREPQASISRAIEQRIISRFKGEQNVAVANDEGIVSLYVPESYQKNWQHFIGVALHTYMNESPEFETMRARQLTEEAVQPDADLGDISYCWEAIGTPALPFVSKLLTDPSPKVAFAAARAAAFIGDPTEAAQAALMQMARTPDHPFQLNAVQVLGELPSSPAVNRMLRELLDSDQTLVRIEAYNVLAQNHDETIFSKVVTEDPNNQKFILDVVPSQGPPLMYATRSGDPRIAIIGDPPHLMQPITFTALDNRLSISSALPSGPVTIFYRDPFLDKPVKMLANPDAAEIIRRLGGDVAEGETPLDLTYCQVVAILQALSDRQLLCTQHGGVLNLAPFVLQQPPRLEQTITSATPVEGTRSQKVDQPPDEATQPSGRPQ